MKTRNLFFVFFCLVAAHTQPVRAIAAVQITEIMYDVSGSDSGREWVEITNLGSGAIDASGFKFFEANTNHALTLVAGSAVLSPQTSAVIVEDEVKFLADWPSFHGTLLKSSFSLSNTGESIAVKDATLSVLDSVAYDSGMGAAGDGNSLRRSGSSFVAGVSDPGIYTQNSNQSSGAGSDSATTTGTVQASVAQSTGGSLPITAHISGDTMVMVGGGSYFSGTAFGTQGLPLQNARYLWNFGDGATAEGQTVFHSYSYPGKYAVSLDAASGFSEGADRSVVEAVAAQVALVAQADGSLAVFNKSQHDLDIGLWTLASLRGTFVIPKNTIVLAGQGVRFSPVITKFFGDTDAKLLYPNESVAASADPSADSPLRGEPIATAGGLPPVAISPPTPARSQIPVLPLAAASQQPFAPDDTTINPAAAAESETAPLWPPFLGLAGLLAVGGAGVWYVRAREPTPAARKETAFDEGEFELE